MIRLYDHERRTVSAHPTLADAVEAAKDRWPKCLILVGAGPSLASSSICVYEDMEDLCDERAVGEIVGDVP